VAERGRRRVAARGEPPLIATPPLVATFVPGTQLAGIHLGDTRAQVRARFGADFGLCRGCATTTWYFTFRKFEEQGIAVEFVRGRVSATYTLWKPQAWRDTRGVMLGDPESRIGPGLRVTCSGYSAVVRGTSVYFVVDGSVWGFGLMRRGRSPCR
jgi:hypothetical protein